MATTTKKTTTKAAEVSQKEAPKKYDHEEVKIRRVNFTFDKETPRFYYKNNPFSTHFINTLHILFPTGERFFVNATLKHQKAIKDEKLKKQVRVEDILVKEAQANSQSTKSNFFLKILF